MMSQFISINGVIRTEKEIRDNSLYNEVNKNGLFETLFMKNGRIRLAGFHFERLCRGLQILNFPGMMKPDAGELTSNILELAMKNECLSGARIRLTVAPDFERPEDLKYLIECTGINSEILNAEMLKIGIYQDEKKSVDHTSEFKLTDRGIYDHAADYAIQNGLDDCLLLNQYNRICDSTISNLFYINGDTVFTPPISEGCVAGVMRRFLVEKAPLAGFEIHERAVDVNELESADAVFLTNAIRVIRPVKQLNNRIFSDVRVRKIYQELNTLLNEAF